jgi:antirestriction protein ArdC
MARTTTTKTRKPAYRGRTTDKPVDAKQDTVDYIIAALEAGTVAWHKDWVNDPSGGDMPTSLSTLKQYGGTNVLVLWLTSLTKGYTSKYWGTYRQIKERGGQVRGGEKGVTINRTISGAYKVKDDSGHVVTNEDGEDETKGYRKLIQFTVFNQEQADWADDARLPQVAERPQDVDPIEAAEALVADYLANGPSLGWGGNQAFYRPAQDHVQMPTRAQFETPAGLYSTLYHELVHSTGHDSREAREGIKKGTFGAFGDKVYSFEELVAEIGSAFLCAQAGIPQEAHLDNSAAYIAHWLKALKEDKGLIFEAASLASAAVARIIGNTATTTNQEGEDA